MSDELKTLKDLGFYDDVKEKGFRFTTRDVAVRDMDYKCYTIDLRSEAIKWLKKYGFEDENNGDNFIYEKFKFSHSYSVMRTAYQQGAKDFIKHFFNITEEELK